MASSNAMRARQYLQAVGALGSYEDVAEFCSPDMVFHEFPNRIAPATGGPRHAAELRESFAKGKQILKSQSYEVKRLVEDGDQVAVEVEWTGILSVSVMNLPAGTAMKAFVAMFLTFRDGKIVSQRNYDCYPPFGS